MAKKKKGTSGSASPSPQGLVVSSKVKAFVKAKGFRSSSDLIDALSARAAQTLSAACQRAKANKRSTVRPADL